jgi:WD40 repeat protein/serine/threonine protein kinase
MISFDCSSCGRRLKVRDERAGKRGKCPACGSKVQVPLLTSPGSPSVDATPDGVSAHDAAAELVDADPDTLPPLPDEADGGAAGRPARDGGRPELYDFLAPPEQPDELGRIDSYRALRVLGRGGMGVVFEAEDLRLRRPVALKVMLPNLAVSAANRQRFLREGQSAAGVLHDHVVTIFQVGEDRGVPFLAMQLLQGETLEDRLGRQKRLPVPEVVRIGREIAEGLAAAHARGLIHRDIKPANVWLEAGRDRVKLLDFGLARAVGGDSRLTQLGVVLGTPSYMSPEQANCKAVDARSDLFSLGCVLYRLCTGTLPFRGEDMLATFTALAVHKPPPVRQLSPDVPAALSDLIAKLLAKKPAERPPSARVVAEVLADIEAGRSPAPALVQEALPDLVPVPEADLEPEVPDALPADEPPPPPRPAVKPAARVEKETTAFEPVPEQPRPRRPFQPKEPEGLSGSGIALVVGGVLVILAVVAFMLLRPREGTLLLDIGPEGAEVLVDGQVLAVSGADGEQMIRLTLPRGDHELQVRKDGFETDVRQVTVFSDLVDVITVRLERSKEVVIVPGPAPDPPTPTVADARVRWKASVPDLPPASALAFDNKRTRLFSAHGPTLKAWALATGKELASHTVKGKPIDCLACSSELGTVAVASGRALTLLELSTLTPRHTGELDERATALAFAPDGRTLAVAVGRSIRLIDAASGAEKGTLTGHEHDVQALRFGDKGGTLISVALDRTVRHWDVAGLKEAAKHNGPGLASVTSATLSPDGKAAVWLTAERTAHAWEVGSGREAEVVGGDGSPLHWLAVTPGGRQLLACSGGGTLTAWEFDSGRRLCDTRPDTDGSAPAALAFTADGKTYALAAGPAIAVGQVADLIRPPESPPERAAVRLTGVSRAEARRYNLLPIFPATQGVTAVAFTPDGRHAVMASTDVCLRVWEVESGKGPGTLFWKERRVLGPVSALTFLSGGGQLLSGSPDSFRLWDLTLAREVPRFELELAKAERLPVSAVVFSADGRRAMTRTNGKLWLWEISTGKLLKSFEAANPTETCLALSGDGQRALDGTALWDLDRFEVIRKLEGHEGSVKRTAFSPDGKRALTAGQDGTLRLWDLSNGRELHRMRGHTAAAVAFSPDGRRALTGGSDGTMRLWDLESGEELHRFVGHAGEVQGVAFSADGRRYLSGGADRTMRLWQLPAPGPAPTKP